MTTFGVAKVEPPQNFAQICDLADEILPAHVAAALRQGNPLGEMAFHKYPTSRWRRYDKLDRFPGGIIPFGDAVVSFNPTFGQGMTMTSLQAGHLRTVLESGADDLANSTRQGHGQDDVSGVDDERDRRPGAARRHRPMPWWYRPVGSLFDQFLGAAETDPVLAEWFLRRFSLLDSLYMVPSARLVGRTIRHNMRLWLAEKRAARSARDREPGCRSITRVLWAYVLLNARHHEFPDQAARGHCGVRDPVLVAAGRQGQRGLGGHLGVDHRPRLR